MKTVCAIMSTYNEEDIVLESIEKLIDSGVNVYLIDNASTDLTVKKIQHLVGKGIVDIHSVKYIENNKEVYDWTSILKLKETLSKKLNYDWFLHVDADEIRYSPWPNISLREAFDRVDHSGYNLVNFKLFNFRLTQDILASDNYERDMPSYSSSEDFNQYQIKAWKSHPEIDLTSYGGHIARRPQGRIYPIRFIHKHYPLRSLEHGKRKILSERKDRFSQAEKVKGWHIQYDQISDVLHSDIFWTEDNLTKFNMCQEQIEILKEGAEVTCRLFACMDLDVLELLINRKILQNCTSLNYSVEHADQVLIVARQLVEMLRQKSSLPPIASSQDDAEIIGSAIKLISAAIYIKGDPVTFLRSNSVVFQTN